MRAHLPFSAAERTWRRHHMGLVAPDHHFATPGRNLTAVGADQIVHGFDVSSYQPARPDFTAGGRRIALWKATEGTGYFDPHFAANRAKAHSEDLILRAIYHFARPGSHRPEDEARYLLSKIGPRQDREVIMLDYEVPPWSVAWIVAFLHVIHDAGWPSLFYSFLGMLSANPTSGIPETGTGLDVAAYGCREPGSDRWDHKDLWQHTDGASNVCGNDGPWDCNRGLASVLAARAGSPPPTPPPAPTPGPPPGRVVIVGNQPQPIAT